MATQTATSLKVSSSIDTSHLKVKFPFKAKYGNYINGKFVEPKSGKYFDKYVKNIYRVLMTRGLKGCYVFCVDDDVKNYFKRKE